MYAVPYSSFSPWKTCTAPFPRGTDRKRLLDRGTVLNYVLLDSETCRKTLRKRWLSFADGCAGPAALVPPARGSNTDWGRGEAIRSGWGQELQNSWGFFSSSADPG